MARVVFLDSYHGPSHAALSTALRDRSRHEVTLLPLPPRKWKWRMRGAAFAFDEMLRRLPAPPELLIATDMLNLPELLALGRGWLPSRLPVFTYFHENQLTYPMPSRDERDFHFGLANVYTALASDRVIFNSAFHRDDFLGAVGPLLRQMPDLRPDGVERRIREKSEVLGLPIDLGGSDSPASPPARENLILWNHRWEEDKQPEIFFRAMGALAARGLDFRLMVLGQGFAAQPACFAEAPRQLGSRIERWGFIPARDEYLAQVARCRFVVSTARHEFFGLAVREAVGLGCWPLLPRRVVYPEIVQGRAEHLYDSEEDLVDRLAALLAAPPPPLALDLLASVARLRPALITSRWDEWIDDGVRSADVAV